MKYIGFDLGDGESCISVLDTDKAQLMPVEYSITGTNAFPTIVGTGDDEQPYIGNLVHNNMTDVRACFKRDYKKQTPDVLNSYRRFIKGVLVQLRLNHPRLFDGEYRFVIGQPADWDKNLTQSFVKLLMECGIENPLLTSESRAALMYFTVSNELGVNPKLLKGSVLIVDLGSSTLDFAYINDGNTDNVKVFGDPHLGGGLMDESIVMQSIEDLEDDEKKRTMYQIMNEDATRRSLLMVEARRLKEAYFESQGEMKKGVKVCPIFSKGIQSFAINLNDELINEVVTKPQALLSGNSLYYQLQNQLNKAKTLTKEHPPELIVLTGGASQMEFFRTMCEETLCQGEALIRYSQSPAYDIARGLALAGRSEENLQALREAVKQYVQSDTVELLVKGKLPNLVETLAGVMIELAMPDVIMPVLEQWKFDSKKSSLNELNERISKSLKGYFNTEKCVTKMQNCIRKWSDSIFSSVQAEIDALCHKYNLHTNVMQIDRVEVAIGNTDAGEAMSISNVVDVIVGMVLATMLGAICGGSGMALIASGVVGVVVGVLIGVAVAFLGTKLAKNSIMNVPLPYSIRRLIKEKNINNENQLKRMQTNLSKGLLQDESLIASLVVGVSQVIDKAIEEAATQQQIG